MMEYTLGKWLEKVDAKLNALLEINGIDSETLNQLEPADQTPQTPEQPEEPEEPIDTSEPQAESPEELQRKADAIKKSMNKQGSKTRWQG